MNPINLKYKYTNIMTDSLSKYEVYSLKKDILVSIGIFSSKSGWKPAAKKAATKAYKKSRKKKRFRRTLFVRKLGTDSMHKYLVSVKKFKCPQTAIIAGDLVKYKTQSKARFKGVIHAE